MKRVTFAMGLVTALSTATPALAAGPWSAPQPFTGAALSGQQLLALPGGGVAVSANTGLGLLTHPGANPTIVAPIGFTAVVSPAGVLGAPAALGDGLAVNALMPLADGRTAAIGTIGPNNHLVSAAGAAGERFADLGALGVARGFVVAARQGAVLVRRCLGRFCARVDLVVVRRRGGRWATPRAITRPGTATGVRSGDVAKLPGGELAFAYEREHAIYERRLTPSGRLSPAQRVGAGVQSHPSIAPGGGHRVIVAWGWQRVSEGDALSPFAARVACSSAIGHFGGHPRDLGSVPVTGTGRYVDGPGVVLRQDDAGRSTLAWTGYQDGRFVVRTGPLSRTCAIAPQTIAVPGADVVLGDLAVGPSGRATLALVAGRRGADAPNGAPAESVFGLLAAQRADPAAPFSGPALVSAPGAFAVDPAVAIDRASGRSVLAWRDVSTGVQLSTAP
ncbi:MAG TPA: hypothetical protein VL120_11950 [Solirubrobacteraceae bacterium]|jgi:hypothetical protein|nr:hypothetical protein [Solirubrobacteraceae bacterium]